MLPTNPPSILTCALRLPPASTTAMSIGCPICSAFRSAPSMTRRASSRVMVSFVFAACAIISLSRCFLPMLAIEPLRRDLAQHTLAHLSHVRSMLLNSYGTQPTLVQYLLGRASITITFERYSHWIPVHGKARRRGYGRGIGVVTPVTGEFEATQETRVVR